MDKRDNYDEIFVARLKCGTNTIIMKSVWRNTNTMVWHWLQPKHRKTCTRVSWAYFVLQIIDWHFVPNSCQAYRILHFEKCATQSGICINLLWNENCFNPFCSMYMNRIEIQGYNMWYNMYSFCVNQVTNSHKNFVANTNQM